MTTNGNASRIDEKIELFVAKKRDPVEPLNIGSSTGGPNRTRWQAHGGESHGATGRTPDRLLDIPIGGIMSSEIVLEGALELNDSIVRVRTDELFGEENGDTGDSGGERKSSRIHCVKERKHDYRPATDLENEEEESELLRELGSRGLWKRDVSECKA